MHQLPHGAVSNRSSSNNQNRNRRQQPQQPQQQPQLQRSPDNSETQQHRGAAAQAHTRAPVLAREPTILESLSRNWRTYLPSSISGSPPPPRRRPLSFGGVIGAPIHIPGVAPNDEEAQAGKGLNEDDGERITWTAWDELVVPGVARPTRVLLLAYATGLQVWDTENLGAVRELLNLKADSLHTEGPILCATVLPPPVAGGDEFEGARPLLGVLTPTHLALYSLATHSVIKQIPFTSPSTIVARPAFIVISTNQPPALHVLSASTLLTLHTISLATAPIFALSHRLLAYASPAPAPAPHSPGPPRPTFISRARDSLSLSVMRVGGEVWSGVKAAVSTSASELADPWGVSRSAPAASASASSLWTRNEGRDDSASTGAGAGWITVLDLAHETPRRVSYFAPFPPEHAGIAYLAFSGGGATPMLSAAPRDGHSVSVFQLRPGTGRGAVEVEAEMPWHWYELRRGMTSAKVESVVWERGGRWAGVATGRRTVHVFPTNAYGGKPDERSHLEGRIYSAPELQPLSTEIGPLVRLRPSTDTEPSDIPLAFTFLPPAASLVLPPALLPHPSTSFSNTSSSTPTRSARSSPVSLSPGFGTRSAFQDVLLFDPAAGMLALRRIALDWVAPPDIGTAGAGAAGYSVSLPVPIGMGMGRRRSEAGERVGELAGRESVVATWKLKRGREWAEVKSALGNVRAVAVGKKGGVEAARGKVSPGDYLSHAELSTHSRSTAVLPRPIYLSHQFSFHALGEDYHALLRRSQLDLPCTKIEVRKEVEVSAYAGDAESDAFIHGSLNDLQLDASTKSRDRRAARGSFDEPIASAMRSVLDYSGQSPPVLPMLPNGASLSVLDAIPIRTKHVAAGVNEGLGRIRREIGKVRSPNLRPTWRVPLEFDEEDEAAFLEGEADADADEHEGRSRDGSGSAASVSVSTPSSRSRMELGATGDNDALWDAWDDEAQAAVAEAETFDEISPTGFMDEEQAPIMAAMSRPQGKGGKGKGKRR